MKGAVQGEAIATASTPDKNALRAMLRDCKVATLLGSTLPNSNKPARFSPITVNSMARAATTAGACN